MSGPKKTRPRIEERERKRKGFKRETGSLRFTKTIGLEGSLRPEKDQSFQKKMRLQHRSPRGQTHTQKESADRKKMQMGWIVTHVPAGRLALAALWCVIRLPPMLDGIVLYVGEKMKDLRGMLIILKVDRNSFMILMDSLAMEKKIKLIKWHLFY